VIRSLGGPAVLVGQSFSGGAATIAAATNPDAVSALVEIGPFTRPPEISVGALVQNAEYRHGAFLLGEFALTGHIKAWVKYLGVAYPGRKPADWDAYLAAVEASLNQPARLDAARKTFSSAGTLKVAAAQLANVKCPVLVVMGRDDSDFPNSETEAQGIIGMLPPGVGSYRMIDSAGHYPHAQYPQQVADAILAFLGKGRAA
jgi:pimeloyl-ACP methyl ester carboxylesterase